jgi:hypothetical protein
MNLIGEVICENFLFALPTNALVPKNNTITPKASNIIIHILIEPLIVPESLRIKQLNIASAANTAPVTT